MVSIRSHSLVNDISFSGGRLISVGIWDTAGEEYDHLERIRRLSYPQTGLFVSHHLTFLSDIFLLAFSLISSSSFENVTAKVKSYLNEIDAMQWLPEIQYHCPNAKYILVGTKLDLRADPITLEKLQQSRRTVVTSEQGQATARKIGAGDEDSSVL
jgi:GTPase SAR1 family protein